MAQASEMIEVRLLGVPAAVREQHLVHAEELMRELTLIQMTSKDESSLPARLLSLAAELDAIYSPFHQGNTVKLDSEIKDEQDQIDMIYLAPRQIDKFINRLVAAWTEADEYCKKDDLLTLPASAEVVAYREWIRDEVSRQVNGAPARRWPGPIVHKTTAGHAEVRRS